MKLMILDGNSIVNRAFYGIRMLNAPDGTPTNGVYGFLTILNKLLSEEAPDGVCVAFDMKGPTFRHHQFEQYKAQRKEMPEDLAIQMPILKQVLDDAGIKRIELEGYEADDLIGTVCRICSEKGFESVVVTGDKDSFQLISGHTRIKHVKSRLGKTETKDYTPEVFFEEYGFEPKKIIDLKALMGDASDNIPGVRGIGEKTAMSLVQSFGSIDNIYAGLSSLDIKEAVRAKLKEGEPSARMSFELATIACYAPIEFSADECAFSGDFNGAYAVFKRLGFNTLIEKWGLSDAGRKRAGMDIPAENAEKSSSSEVSDHATLAALEKSVKEAPYVSVFLPQNSLDQIEIYDGKSSFSLAFRALGDKGLAFMKLLFSQQIRKVSHNVKDLIGHLLSERLDCSGFVFDTALAAYLLEPTESSYELSRLCAKYIDIVHTGASAVFSLYPALSTLIEEAGMMPLLENIELPLCEVLANMEKAGFAVDKAALGEYSKLLSLRIDELSTEIFELSGEEFNINSPKQMGVILFEKLALPSGKKTKTGWSTNADVLDTLVGKHPIVEKILEYRQYTKLKSTYADGLTKVIADDGRIHTSFQMTVTATGRLSSTEPNLQNIPVRSELGAEFRKMFVAEAPYLLVDADYSQIELRLLAHISGDETMKKAFLNGEDIHSVTASQVFGVPLGEVTKLQRSYAKAVNFGIVYGISAFSLAQDIGVFQNEAKAYIDAYLSKYNGVRDYMKAVVEKAKQDGFVTTLFGRRRPLPELKSANHNLRSFGERVALNTPIQGTAADIIKLAMVNVFRRLKSENLKARLILQVHDELIVECPENEAPLVAKLLAEEMENAVSYTVPLTVDAHIGKSWSEAK